MAGNVDLARRLSWLLAERMAYRRQWLRHEQRSGNLDGSTLHQGAICQVLAQHLWDSGEAPETQCNLPRQLKDRVSRALRGADVSAATLELFVAAFGMTEVDTNDLWALWYGQTTLVLGDGAGQPQSLPVQRGFETVSVHERHTIGSQQSPIEHRVSHVIRATTAFHRYTFQFDTHAADVFVLHGGTAGPLRQVEEGFHAVDIELPQTLYPGETAGLEYAITFNYPRPPAPCFRRGFRRRAFALSMEVSFQPDCLPTNLRWARWGSHLDSEPNRTETVRLDSSGSAHRFLATVENAAVGFVWSWD